MKYLLIEPHADDLILSMHLTLQRLKDQTSQNELFMTTISNMPGPEWVRSTGLPAPEGYKWEPYAEKMGATFVSLQEMADIDLRVFRMNPHEVKKHPAPYTFTVNHFLGQFRDLFEVEMTPLVEEALGKVNPDVVYLPLGIWHPMHIGVRYIVEKLWKGKRVYYADYPYITNKYGQTILDELKKTHLCIYSYVGTEDEVKAKQKLVQVCYPSVANILRFSGPPMFTTPEQLFALRPEPPQL